jgi:hypothetical protein
MKASYLLEAKYICVHAKKGKYECEAESSYGAAKKAAEHWGLKSTAGIDAHLADKPKTATEGIEGMTPNTQVRGIMPKQRKPYHKHKIKSDYEPETDLNEDAKATMPFMDVIKQHYVEDMDGNTPADMDEARLYLDGRKLVYDVRDMLEGETGAEVIALSEDAMGGHPKALLMKVVKQMQDDAAMGDYTAIDDLLKDIPQERLEGFLSEVESVQEEDKGFPKVYNDTGKLVANSIETALELIADEISKEDYRSYMYAASKGDYESLLDALDGFGYRMGIAKEEDEEYDPRRVKADVVKHLINMYNDAKKDGGYSSEKMHFALGNLLHDMDMAGYMNSDYFDIEGFFHKGIAKKQDYKVSMQMLRRAINQAKGLDTDTSVDPAVFKRGGSAMKSVATEDNPLPKNFLRMIASSDNPHDEIEGLMKAKGPAGDYIRREYEITAGENGLHGDDDHEEIIDMMVHDFEDRTFEGTSMLGEVVKELTEEEFDEAAGKKDACYRKVKSRYKVWPSAYASGALVQCRKVGAANWGNKSKK